MSKLLPRSSLILLVLLLCTCWGCGGQVYRDRLEAGLDEIRGDTPFKKMFLRSPLPGTSVTYRIPMIFEKSYAGSAKLSMGRKASFEIQGLQLTWEGFVEARDAEGNPAGKYAFYCYLAGIPMTDTRHDPAVAMKTRIASGFSLTGLDWRDVQCKREDGTGVQWQWLKVLDDPEQLFYFVDKDGKETYRKMQGRVEIFSRREGDTHIFVVWRVPVSIMKSIEFDKWARMVPGSFLQSTGEPAPEAETKDPATEGAETEGEAPEEGAEAEDAKPEGGETEGEKTE